MDWMGLEKIVKKFELFGIQTHPIPLNPHGLRANRTSPNMAPNDVQGKAMRKLTSINHTHVGVVMNCDPNVSSQIARALNYF
jgi:hypothetical protein